jgi:mRNA interferase RelE/StbE
VGRFRLLYKRQAFDDIRALTPQVQRRLNKKSDFFIAQEDPLQFAQPLTKPADAQYRFRVGDFRVLFDVDGFDIMVLHVQHRREVYRR